jgi:hypothetical protein
MAVSAIERQRRTYVLRKCETFLTPLFSNCGYFHKQVKAENNLFKAMAYGLYLFMQKDL